MTSFTEPNVKLAPQPAGLRHRFHAMVKPVGSLCHLDCTYGYYLHKEGLLHQPKAARMSDEMLELHIRQYIEAQTGSEVVFSWQGGQPTQAEIMAAARLLKKHRVPFNGLCVVIRENALYPKNVYRFLTREWGVWRVQLISCVGPEVFRNTAPQKGDAAGIPVVGTPPTRPGTPDSSQEPVRAHSRGRGRAELSVPGIEKVLRAHPARHADDSAPCPLHEWFHSKPIYLRRQSNTTTQPNHD